MLTGFDSVSERVSGLDAGADDYLVKPFEGSELLARLRAILRRPNQTISNELEVGDLKLDIVAHEVERMGTAIKLMPKEFALLEYLMRRAGQAISRDDLLQHVWGIYSRNTSNRLEVYVRYLREKIDDPFENKLIQTVRGTGYKIGPA
jgi:DNA-binding response OmpR family regulator